MANVDGLSEEIQQTSKRLFGSALRLPVAALIARHDPGVVWVGGILEELGLPAERYTAVRLELEHFARAGLLMRLPKPRGQKIQEYQRLGSRYWDMAVEVMAETSTRSRRARSRS